MPSSAGVGMSLALMGIMESTKGKRVVIAESGSPWFVLVRPSSLETVVIAQTPNERKSDFGRRVKDRLAALGEAHVTDIFVVTRRQAPQRAAHWIVERASRAYDAAS